jgi:signal transduction histidine kinase
MSKPEELEAAIAQTAILEGLGERFVSIRKKMIVFATRVLMVTMGLLLAVTFLLTFVDWQIRYRQMTTAARENLISKGTILVVNNSTALRMLAADNAFLAVQDLVSATVLQDRDIIYGIFMDARRQPWVHADATNPKGSVTAAQVLDDTLSDWAAKLAGPDFRQLRRKAIQVLEFAAPVISNGERLGTIRYGITTAGLRDALARAKRDAIVKSLLYPLFLLVLGGLAFVFVTRDTRRQASAITRPLHHLTQAASRIARGHYNTAITTTSNDEVGVLAKNFQKMQETIKLYTTRLEQMVRERTEQLEEAQKELVNKAHKAGMADIASGTLHNVGNILNSVKASVEVLDDMAANSSVEGLQKANALLRANMDTIETFVASDPKGKKLLQYYLKLEEAMTDELQQTRHNARRLLEKVNAIADVIAAQQNYAGVAALTEELSLADVIDDALTMQSGSIERYGIIIEKDVQSSPRIRAQKIKLMHILINLVKNAKEAMLEIPPQQRKIRIAVTLKDNTAFVKVSDSGKGIPQECIGRIFSHGFTTKTGGHGFGLHSSANYVREMGGEMWAESKGDGYGATFVLKFPLAGV